MTVDFVDYVAERGGVYLPFPRAVEYVYEMEWCNQMWGALIAGERPPADRVADMLARQASLKPYLPPEIARGYPDVPNPHLPTVQRETLPVPT